MVPKEWRLEWRQWGAYYVVFNPASGDTHLLNAVSALVLTSLEKRASTKEELASLVSNFRAQPSSDALSGDIEALVSELDELGLIAPSKS